MFGVFRVKNVTPKNHIFSNFRGARAGCAPRWIRPCNIKLKIISNEKPPNNFQNLPKCNAPNLCNFGLLIHKKRYYKTEVLQRFTSAKLNMQYSYLHSNAILNTEM